MNSGAWVGVGGCAAYQARVYHLVTNRNQGYAQDGCMYEETLIVY